MPNRRRSRCHRNSWRDPGSGRLSRGGRGSETQHYACCYRLDPVHNPERPCRAQSPGSGKVLELCAFSPPFVTLVRMSYMKLLRRLGPMKTTRKRILATLLITVSLIAGVYAQKDKDDEASAALNFLVIK